MYKIISVVVIFNPDESCLENIKLIASQCYSTIVVNNGIENINVSKITTEIQKLGGKIINNSGNMGIATGFNVGVFDAVLNGADWIAVFDQDSRIPQNYFTRLLQSYEAIADKSKVRLLSPVYYDPQTETLTSYAPEDQLRLSARKINVTISSGNLIKRETFFEIGFFLDKLFIDQVDTEFCLRIIRGGFEIFEIRDACLSHSLGNQVAHKFMRRSPIVTNHSAERRYYSARNRLYIYKNYFRHNKSWIVNDIKRLMKEIILLIFFEESKKKKLLYSLQGLVDGIVGKYGPYEVNHSVISVEGRKSQ